MKTTIERQHQNYQESYNSLLQTSTQIKNRLYDSLAKFQEYEDALDNIIKNLESLEPQIRDSLDTPVEEVEDVQKEYDNFRVISNSPLPNIIEMLFSHLPAFVRYFPIYRASTIGCRQKRLFCRTLFRPARQPPPPFRDRERR